MGGTTFIGQCQKKLDDLKVVNGFPGGNLCIIIGDRNIIKVSTGVSNKKSGRRMNAMDRMFSGSVGKTYVSAVLLQLFDEGRIDLDDKIEKYLGLEKWFPRLRNGKLMTVRMLMNHTSGIREHVIEKDFCQNIIKKPDKEYLPIELVAYILGKESLFEPGKGWSYADTNYILIGMIIEKITKKRKVVFIWNSFPNWMSYFMAFYPSSSSFRPIQIITHMFMHGNITHIFFNMFMLYMFGSVLENYWGGKYFLFLYLVSGFGALAFHFLVKYIAINYYMSSISPELYERVLLEGREVILAGKNYSNEYFNVEQYFSGTPYAHVVSSGGNDRT